MSLLAHKRAIARRIREGKPPPEPAPKALSLRHIEVIEEVFQHRRPLEHQSDYHVKELAKVPTAGQPLDPVTVFWGGDAWLLVDGHHRLAAYRKAKWRRAVPVRVFTGSLDQAMACAAKNTRATLQMSRSEKMRAAWILVAGTELSITQTIRACGVSEGTVAAMRRVKLALLGKCPNRDLTEDPWEAARREHSGESVSDADDAEDRIEKEAEFIANALARALGKRGQVWPEALARALEMYDSRFPSFVMDFWASERETDEDTMDEF